MSNVEQARYWNAEGGTRWTSMATFFRRMLAPFVPVLLGAARPQPGEQVLDVGCGFGDTTLAMAEAVGPDGRVTALDISQPLLDQLAERVAAAGVANIDVVAADAQTAPLPAAKFDLLVSRFGVMFFDDPAAAFTNLAASVRPGGRLAFVCWQPLAANPWFLIPFQAAREVFPDAAFPPPGSPGPFAFADADRVRGILTTGGFDEVGAEPITISLDNGEADDATTHAASSIIDRFAKGATGEQRDAATAAMRRALAEVAGSDGRVVLDGAAWVVTARKPG